MDRSSWEKFMIVYVSRDITNNVTGVFAISQFQEQEAIDDGSADVVAFMNKISAKPVDALLARVTALESKVAAISAVPVVASALTPVVIGL